MQYVPIPRNASLVWSAYEPPTPTRPFPPIGPHKSQRDFVAAHEKMLLVDLESVPTHIHAASHVLASASILIGEKYFQENLRVLAPLVSADLFRHRLANVANLINQEYVISLQKNIENQIRIINTTQERFSNSTKLWTAAIEHLEEVYKTWCAKVQEQKEELARVTDAMNQKLNAIKAEVAAAEARLVEVRQRSFFLQYHSQSITINSGGGGDDDATDAAPRTPAEKKQRKSSE